MAEYKKTTKELIDEIGQLRLHNEDLKNILQASNIGTWEWNIQTGKLLVNEQWAQLFGLNYQELHSVTIDFCRKLFHPDDLILSNKQLAKHISGDIPYYDIECRFKHGQGHWIWIHDRGKIVSWTKDGQPLLMCGTHTDITERKQNELLLQNYYNIINRSPATAFIWKNTDSWPVEFVSENVKDIFGYTVDDFLSGKISYEKVIHPKDLQRVFDEVTNSIKDDTLKEFNHMPYRIISKYKETKWVEDKTNIVRNQKGEVTHFQGIVQDITERKKTEIALQKSEENLIASQKIAKIGHYVFDIKTGNWTSSTELDYIFGLEPDYSKDIATWLDIIHSDFKEKMLVYLQEDILKQHQRFDKEYKIKTFLSGKEKWVHGLGNLKFDENGNPIEMFGTIQDISERKQIEESLRLLAQSTSTNDGSNFLGSIAKQLSEYIQTDYTIIGELKKEQKDTIQTIAVTAGNNLIENISYKLADTPCEQVVGNNICSYKSNVADLFPKDDMLKQMGVEGYIGVPLFDSHQNPSGILIALFKKPIKNLPFKEAQLRIFSLRIESEMEHSLAEKTLRNSEEKNRLLVENSPFCIHQFNMQEKFISMNNAGLKMLGLTNENEVKNKWFFDYVHESEKERLKELFNDAYNGHASEYEFRAANDKIFLSSLIPIYNDDKDVVRLMGITQDITNRKKSEETNARLSRAIEQVDEAIVITDANGIIEYVNPAFEKTSGYTAVEAIGKNPNIIKSSYHDINFYLKLWDTLLSGNQWKGDIVNKKKNGTLYTENVTISPVYNPEGKIVNFVAAKKDITETKRLQELESRAGRLELAGTIAGQVAHDFNNLLAPIMAYPEFIREELSHDNKAQAYLDTIEESAKKIAEINQDLLTMGRRGHYSQDIINLNNIIMHAIKGIEHQSKTVSYSTDLCEELMNIKGGGAQILRMLTNLFVNSIDAMQKIGNITIKSENYYADDTSIEFGRVPKGEYVKLTISDDGCGIPNDIIENILDPFFSTKTANKKSGSGLGLSVVDSVMKDHNGHLDLNSVEGIGTSFYLYFPITREETIGIISKDVIGGAEIVLVVDDDDIQREVSMKLLTKLGYNVSAVESGEKAIEFVKDNPQDLIILDMVMSPGIDGTETYKQICKTYPQQKAIIVSGFSESERVYEAQKMGVGAFVSKPFTKDEIAVAVRSEINRYTNEHQLSN